MTERAFVTGATGFLGTHLVRRLVAEGWAADALRRETSDTAALAGLGVDWTTADVRDADALAAAVGSHDAVFHLAGLGLQRADADTVRSVNAEGTAAVVQACRGADVGRLVFTSTAGTRRRPDGEPATEADRAEPIGAYQASKAAAEEWVADYVADGGDAVVVHPTSVFGPGDEGFTAQLLGLARNPAAVACPPGGVSVVGVGDVVDGLLAALRRGCRGEHYILGGQNLTVREAAEVVVDVAGGHPPVAAVPPAALRAAGPVVERVNDALGTRLFPVNRDMAALATQELFYDSAKAARELDYSYAPLSELVEPALRWYSTL